MRRDKERRLRRDVLRLVHEHAHAVLVRAESRELCQRRRGHRREARERLCRCPGRCRGRVRIRVRVSTGCSARGGAFRWGCRCHSGGALTLRVPDRKFDACQAGRWQMSRMRKRGLRIQSEHAPQVVEPVNACPPHCPKRLTGAAKTEEGKGRTTSESARETSAAGRIVAQCKGVAARPWLGLGLPQERNADLYLTHIPVRAV